MKIAQTALFAATLFTAAAAHASDYSVDAVHSQAAFSVRHMMVSNVRGELGKVTATVVIDDKDITKSTVEATIDVTGINTHEPKRDGHLKSPDFFDVAKFPTLTFKSKSVKKVGAKLQVAGDLTIRGVAKPVTLDVEVTPEIKSIMGDQRRGVSATTKISRKEWGLTWNKALEGGGLLVGDEVTINIDLELVKAGAPAPAAK